MQIFYLFPQNKCHFWSVKVVCSTDSSSVLFSMEELGPFLEERSTATVLPVSMVNFEVVYNFITEVANILYK